MGGPKGKSGAYWVKRGPVGGGGGHRGSFSVKVILGGERGTGGKRVPRVLNKISRIES